MKNEKERHPSDETTEDNGGFRLRELPPMRNLKNFWMRNSLNLGVVMMGGKPERIPLSIILDGDWICDFTGVDFEEYYTDFAVQQKARMLAGKAAVKEIGMSIRPWIDFGVVQDASIYGGKVVYSSTAPPTIEPAIGSPGEVTELARRMDEADPLSLGLVPKMLEWRARLKAEYGVNYPAGVAVKGAGTICGQICGMTEYMMWLVTHEKEMLELAALIERTTIRYIRALRKASAVKFPFLAVADDVSGMMSEKMYRKFIYPAHKRVYRELAPIHSGRFFHNDARTNHILHHLRKLHLGAVNLGTCVTVRDIRERVPRSVIFGHIPPVEVLWKGTPEEVRNAAHANIAHALADGGRIVLTSAGSINPGTSFENIKALMQASREHIL